MNINEKTITLRNLEIEEKDFKEFHKYLNDFYGKRGVYPNRYGKDLQPRDILKAIDSVASKRPKHDWEWDSLDREIVRDELIKMRKFDYPTQESAIKELFKVHEDESEEVKEADVPGRIPSQLKVKLEKAVAQIKDSNLTYPQRLKVLSHVLDSLDIDKKELTKMTTRLKGTLEGVTESVKPSQVRSVISRVKKDLMKKWKQKGGYENFGDKEGRVLRDKFNFNPYGSPEERQIAQMIQGFENWAMNYDGSMREGKKVFKVNPGIGKVKYSISSHDGKKKHKDGSDFYDIETFKNKVDLEKAIKKYTSQGFKMESVNEAKNDDKYVVIDFHEKGGGFVMTKPGSKKNAEDSARSIRKGSDISKREVLKVSDARKIRGLAGKNYLNEADVVGKTIFSDGKGKLFFGYYKTDDAVEFVDYKTWKKLGFKDVSKGDTNKDRVIKAIVKGQKQFNKQVDFNMWSKKNNPSFEEKMDWFIKNGWINNINKGGIKG